MSEIKVTLSELQTTAANLINYAEDYLSTANKLLQAAQSFAGHWEGEDADAYLAKEEEAHAWYEKMANLVTDYAKQMKTASEKYAKADAEAAAAINKRR